MVALLEVREHVAPDKSFDRGANVVFLQTAWFAE